MEKINFNEEIARIAVKELIICYAFLEGLWIYSNVNPIDEIIKIIAPTLRASDFGWYIDAIWIIIFVVIPIALIILTYYLGGVIGLIALLFAFSGGIFIDSIGILLVILGMLLGFYSFSTEKKISFLDIYDFVFDR